MKITMAGLRAVLIGLVLFPFIIYIAVKTNQERVLRLVIERLSADSRIAEVVVTGVRPDPKDKKTYTTIKFLEYDARSRPLKPRYFTFSSDIIQFQSLVIRFDDYYVKKAHPLKGRSAYIFMKAFALTPGGAEVFEINSMHEVPSGYRIGRGTSGFERVLWMRFWDYALKEKEVKRMGVKNAQIEAPGTRFVPGIIYTIKIEHDGGMRIDTQALPEILKEE